MCVCVRFSGCIFRFSGVFCIDSDIFRPKITPGARFWAKTKFQKSLKTVLKPFLRRPLIEAYCPGPVQNGKILKRFHWGAAPRAQGVRWAAGGFLEARALPMGFPGRPRGGGRLLRSPRPSYEPPRSPPSRRAKPLRCLSLEATRRGAVRIKRRRRYNKGSELLLQVSKRIIITYMMIVWLVAPYRWFTRGLTRPSEKRGRFPGWTHRQLE